MSEVVPLRYKIEPVRLQVAVPLAPEHAFEMFTAAIHRWWPLGRFSIFGERASGCGIEPHVGGLVWETGDDGERAIWGQVLVWEPPHRFVMTWHPGRAVETAQEVEVRFSPELGGTLVHLEHRGWESLGDEALETRSGYEQGWVFVVDHCFGGICSAG